MLINVTESRIDQYQNNVSDAKSLLDFMDTTFEQTTTSLQQAKEIAVKGANDTYSDTDRKAMADSVEEIIKQVVGFANSKHLDRYMFSGQKIDVSPITYDGTNFTYNGDNNAMTIDASEQVKATVSQSAGQVFVPVLNQLVKLRDALNANDHNAIEAAMNGVDTETNKFIDNHSKIGVQSNSIDLLNEAYSQTKTDLGVKRQQTEDVDMATAISDFTYMQQIYQATIKSSMSMLNNSILQYI
jgi:flagellar hook-associated protein 3 FlgL